MKRSAGACILSLAAAMLLTTVACSPPAAEKRGGKIVVVATLFPLYDFARNIGGDRVEVTLLLPPGAEPHTFEPKPGDILKLNRAAVFLFTSEHMEPWAADLLWGLQNKSIESIDASRGLLPGAKPGGDPDHRRKIPGKAHDQRHRHDTVDPHIWLDFSMSMKMVENIRDGLIRKDPAGKEVYERQAEAYRVRLRELDGKFRSSLQGCRKSVLVHGGHFAFAYMADRYGFRYVSVYGITPDAEPTAATLSRVKKALGEHHLHYMFYEEFVNPRVASVISREARVSLLPLHPAGNVTREEIERGETYLSLMEKNLENLRTGLECPKRQSE